MSESDTAKSVIERRKEYAQELGVSVSTFERREEVGLHQLAEIIGRVVLKSDVYGILAHAEDQVDFVTWALRGFSPNEAELSDRISGELHDIRLRVMQF